MSFRRSSLSICLLFGFCGTLFAGAYEDYSTVFAKQTKAQKITSNGWFIRLGAGLDHSSFNDMKYHNPNYTNVSVTHTSGDDSFMAKFGFGYQYRFNHYLNSRYELDFYTHAQSEHLEARTSVNSGGTPILGKAKLRVGNAPLLANVYLMFQPETSRYGVFINGGMGVAYVETISSMSRTQGGASISGYKYRNKVLTPVAYDAGAGLLFQLNKRVDLSLGYQYISSGRIKTGKTRLNNSGELLHGFYQNDVFMFDVVIKM
jgi:opacity protein-like surface antigen